MKQQVIFITLFVCIATVIGIVRTLNWYAGKNDLHIIDDQRIVSGFIQEITENNFVKGIDHDFTPDELQIWNEVYQSSSVQEEQGYILNGTQKYIINLYDSNENEILEYLLDDNGQLYDGKRDGQAISCDEIIKMLEQIIAKNK